MELSEILYRWELVYDILKHHWEDGRHFADPEHTRTGFIELYDKVAQLEATLEEIREVAKQVHNEVNTEFVPLWVMEKCTKALGGE